MSLSAQPKTEEQTVEMEKVEELELRLASYNERIQADAGKSPRNSEHYPKMVEVIVDLHEEYRKRNEFDKEMRLYDSQQELFARVGDERESTPWQLYKGACCDQYGKREEALTHLESAYQLSQTARKVRSLAANGHNSD